jgi:hypothetical protein
MFRLVLTLLIALQMLVPPGMCVCQLARVGSASAGTSYPLEVRHAAVHSDCRCESCSGRVADDHGRKVKPSDSPVAPKHNDHAPHCPAALGDLPTKMAVPALVIHLDTDVGFVSAVVEQIAIGSRDREIVCHVTTSPPLFISHCALVI